MGKPTGFLEIERHDRGYAPVAERLKHWKEFRKPKPISTPVALRRCGNLNQTSKQNVACQTPEYQEA